MPGPSYAVVVLALASEKLLAPATAESAGAGPGSGTVGAPQSELAAAGEAITTPAGKLVVKLSLRRSRMCGQRVSQR